MDTRHAPADADSERRVAVLLYAAGTPFADVRDGSGTATDLAPFASRIEQSPDQVTVQLAWHRELYGTAQPAPGQLIAVSVQDVLLWIGLIEGVNDYREQSGTRTMSLTARRRDATAKWRSQQRTTGLYPMGTALGTIIADVAAALGLTDEEIALPPFGTPVAQSNMQLSGLTGWDMLETLMLPGGYSPFVDGLGRLRARRRDLVGRTADLTLDADRLVAVTGARARPPLTALRLKWLDPRLTETTQSARVLGNANITAGFFQMEQRQDIWWSDDHTQRARDTYLVIKQSANSGLFDVCDESYQETSHEGGQIVLETAVWVPALLTLFLAVKAAGALPDGVGTGFTIPIGKKVQAALELTVLLVLASIGTGSYEVWGTPYDYIHARNVTEAYDPDAPEYAEFIDTLESDLITDASHAQAVAARELIYRARSASSYGAQIIDDPRLEPGDLIALPDGSRIYVTDYRRDLSRGAPARLDVTGFRAR